MHTWAPDRFRAVLAALRRRTGLSDAEIARMAGKSRSQVNRWSRAENQPGYDGLRQLATTLSAERYPDDVVQLAHDLVEAAGYGSSDEQQHTGRPGHSEYEVHLTLMVNPDEPEPDAPPGGLRDQVERIIWAITDEPWHIRWAQIQTRRELESSERTAADTWTAESGS